LSDSPIAIGGIGGSGTRLIATVLRRLGLYMGADLNGSEDNLWFTLLFKRLELLTAQRDEVPSMAEIFVQAMRSKTAFTAEQTEKILSLAAHGRAQHPASWLRHRAIRLLEAPQTNPDSTRPWGWKEPNTHIFMDRLPDLISGLRYIHVVRSGLDMAHSRNQNQQSLWGPVLLGHRQYPVSPAYSLRYWCAVHKRIISLGRGMGSNFLLLNYDKFCVDPDTGLNILLDFLGIVPSSSTIADLRSLIKPSASIGRYRQRGLDIFDAGDVEYVRELGFDVV
jgi:hypothetical protein